MSAASHGIGYRAGVTRVQSARMVQHDNAARAQDPHRVGEVTRMVEDPPSREDEFV